MIFWHVDYKIACLCSRICGAFGRYRDRHIPTARTGGGLGAKSVGGFGRRKCGLRTLAWVARAPCTTQYILTTVLRSTEKLEQRAHPAQRSRDRMRLCAFARLAGAETLRFVPAVRLVHPHPVQGVEMPNRANGRTEVYLMGSLPGFHSTVLCSVDTPHLIRKPALVVSYDSYKHWAGNSSVRTSNKHCLYHIHTIEFIGHYVCMSHRFPRRSYSPWSFRPSCSPVRRFTAYTIRMTRFQSDQRMAASQGVSAKENGHRFSPETVSLARKWLQRTAAVSVASFSTAQK